MRPSVEPCQRMPNLAGTMRALLALGLRFARGRDSAWLAGTALTLLSVAVATIALIALLAAPAVVSERKGRSEARLPRSGVDEAIGSRFEQNRVHLGGQVVYVNRLARQRGSALPPGVSEPASSNAWYVSPALTEAVERLPLYRIAFPFVTTAQNIAPNTLEDRGDLIAYQLVDSSEASTRAYEISGFGADSLEGGGVSWARSFGILLFLLLPLSAILWAAARLNSLRKDSRLRSLRMLGVSRGRLAIIAATELVVVAFVGACVGALAVALILPHLGRVNINGSHLNPSDVPLWSLAILAISLMTIVTAALGVGSSHLQLKLETAVPRSRTVRNPSLLWLAFAVATTLVVIVVAWSPLGGNQDSKFTILQIAIPALGISVTAALPLLVREAAKLVNRFGRLNVVSHTALKRVSHLSESAARPARLLSISTFVLITSAVVLTSFWVDLAWSKTYRRGDDKALLTVQPSRDIGSWQPTEGQAPVYAYVPLLSKEGAEFQTLIASCAELEVLNAGPLPDCDERERTLRIVDDGLGLPVAVGPADDPLKITNTDELSLHGLRRFDPAQADLNDTSLGSPIMWYVVVDRALVDDFTAQETSRDPLSIVQRSSLDLLDIAPSPGDRWILAGAVVALVLGLLGSAITSVERALITQEADYRFIILGASRWQRVRRTATEILFPLVIGGAVGATSGVLASAAYREAAANGELRWGMLITIVCLTLLASSTLALFSLPAAQAPRA